MDKYFVVKTRNLNNYYLKGNEWAKTIEEAIRYCCLEDAVKAQREAAANYQNCCWVQEVKRAIWQEVN